MNTARTWLWLAVAVQIIAIAVFLNLGAQPPPGEAQPKRDQPPALAAPAQLVEADPAQSPPADPLGAWAVARQLVPAGKLIRRIAFAGHGFFVFYGSADGSTIEASFVGWRDGLYALDRIDPGSPRDPDICKAPGVSPQQIEPAIHALLRDPVYRQHQRGLDSLFLECHAEQLFWMLLPLPPEGYQAGQPLQTIDLPFLQAERPLLEH